MQSKGTPASSSHINKSYDDDVLCLLFVAKYVNAFGRRQMALSSGVA